MEQALPSSSYWDPTLDSHSTTSIPPLLWSTPPLGGVDQRTGDRSWADCWDDGSKLFVFPDKGISLSVEVSFNCPTWTFLFVFLEMAWNHSNEQKPRKHKWYKCKHRALDYWMRVTCTWSRPFNRGGLLFKMSRQFFCHGDADTCRSATMSWFAYRSSHYQRYKCELAAFCNRWLQFADSESTLVSLWVF